VNKVLLTGRLTRDPELRSLASGKAVTQFSVAAGRSWTTPDGERHEETEWFNVVAWAKLAEQCNQLITKGRRVYIEGRLQTRSWDDKESGQKRYRTEVIANVMLLLDQRPPGGGGGTGSRDDSGFPTDEVEPDDIPF
jgi:single-strand DNA-binding protein